MFPSITFKDEWETNDFLPFLDVHYIKRIFTQICDYYSQNIHLVRQWLPRLEKKLEAHSEAAHLDYRVFMSAEPANRPENHILPQVMMGWQIGL